MSDVKKLDLPEMPEPPVAVRMVQQADGRVGFPDVVEYELVEGEGKGLRLICPPTLDDHPDLFRKEGQPGTVGYETRVHDLATYEILKSSGILYHPRHTGSVSETVDNRSAPRK